MKKITKVKLFPNNNDISLAIYELVRKKLIDNGFEVVEKDFDLGIAIGGDGAFLRMLKNSNFDSIPYYVGINTGTLGFLQEIKPEEITIFIEKLKNQDFKLEEVGIQETKVVTQASSSIFYSLNEMLIREVELNTAKLEVYIDDVLLEKYVGDGIMVSTSVGSTAYNLSFGGSIVFNTLHTLQITPIAPLNTKAYRDLLNSIIIPEEMIVKLVPINDKKDLIITIDGENNIYNDVKEIITGIGSKKITFLRLNDYNFTKIVNEKFLN